MLQTFLKAKIHRATVTDTQLDYSGSITIDKDLMDAAGIAEYEKVLIANITNGTRHETYTVIGEPGSGIIRIMGAAAHLVNTDDKIIIMSFAQYTEAEAATHKPRIILVDEKNRPIPKS